MAVIKYKDKNGNWRTLTENVNVSGDTSGVYVGNEEPVNPNCKVWYDTSYLPTPLAKCKLPSGEWVITAGGGGVGGGSTNNAEFDVKNETGWITKTIAYGAECSVLLSWSSVEDDIPTGNGTAKISVGDVLKTSFEIEQGEKIPIRIDRYLIAGTNDISISISDIYGNMRVMKFTVTTVSVSISSYFDSTQAYTGDINFSYIPVGAVEKTVYFLVDGETIDTQTVTVSGREQSFTIPAQPHGSHTFEVYFTCVIDGQTIPSNHLVYDLICYEDGRTSPIIASAFSVDSIKQFTTLPIDWIAYTPQLLTTEVTITDNFGYSTTRTVDRTVQTLSYKAENVGATELTFSVGGEVKKVISFPVVENQIDVIAETSNLELYLNAKGRSNEDNKQNPSEWAYGNIKADLQNFNFVSDGWQLDDKGDTILRVSGNARVYIPLNIFGSDFRTNGKTIEFEFATRDVLNPNSTVISCWSGERGIKITAQEALLKSELSEISRQYKENEHIRVTFTVQKKAENRLLSLYINGIQSACVQYGEDDDFSQAFPVGISIGSNLCTTDIYCIRTYNNNLTRYQVLDNWVADTQDIEELVLRYDRNNVFDDYGNVDIKKLPQTLPYFVIDVEKYLDLPQYKGDKKTISGKYVDPLHPERSFTFYDAEIDVQGTSSQFYSRKNYKIKFKNGFTIAGVSKSKYQLRETSMPTDVFTFKADVASSEGANNVELVMLYDEICPVKTPPQEIDDRVRQGIEGYPCLMFYYDGNNYNFIGKYNFNNDKATEEIFGFGENDESWEILTNETQMAVFKGDDFESTYYDTVKKKELPLWTQTFEARYPEDNMETTNLNAFVSWLKSTDTTAVNTEEEKQIRLDKFRNELGNYANIEALIFNYVFTEAFLMVDNRAKNAFPTRYSADGKWLILPYDYDTAIGINNEGELKFGYWLEDTDLINGTKVYNGQDSVLYVNLRLAFADEIMAMYQDLRKLDAFSYKAIENRFEEHQKAWGEAIFNEDAKFKYTDPLVNDGDNTYLEMLQGSKESQRQWWLYNRFRYLDSKYVAGDSLEDYIMLRPYAVSDITITPYADIYASIKFDNILVQERALRGDGDTPNSYTLKNPLENGNHGVIAIYSASQLASVGDLSGLKVGMANFSMATKLNEVILGNSIKDENNIETYSNPNLNTLTIGNLNLLSKLDIRNCTGLTSVVDVSGCANIEKIYAEGSAVTGVKTPNGGILKTLHLPQTVTSLIIQNQKMLTDFSIPTFSNVSTLRLEGVNYELFDIVSILNQIQINSRIRLLDIEMNINSATEILTLYDKFDTFRGLDESGNTLDYAVISGTIHCGTITSNDYAEMVRRYPNINIDYEHITSTVSFYVDGTLVHTTLVYDGADCYNPITENIIDIPTKAENETSKFIFNSWDKSLKTVTEDKVINAVFDEYKKHKITFKDDKGNIVQVNGNDTNIYYDRTGENVVKVPANLDNYTYTDDSGVSYNMYFKGWRNADTKVESVMNINNNEYEDIVYEAVFTSEQVYVVMFTDPYNTAHSVTLYLEEGDEIKPTLSEPVRLESENGQFYHNFKGWSTKGANLLNQNIEQPASNVGAENITYYAVYDSELRSYEIIFYGIIGGTEGKKQKVLYQNTLDWGTTMPIPTDDDLAVVGYTFKKWDKTVDPTVKGERVYTAEYDINYYTIKFVDWDDSIIGEEQILAYNTEPARPDDPTRAQDVQYSYDFIGWSPTVEKATSNVTYKANYQATTREYEIKFVGYTDFDGTIVDEEKYTIKYGIEPQPRVFTRTGYDLVGWVNEKGEFFETPPIVKGNATYTAQYSIKIFTVKFVNPDGSVISSQTIEYGKSVTIPNVPNRTYHTFIGWDKEIVTKVTSDATYNALYDAKVFSVTGKPTSHGIVWEQWNDVSKTYDSDVDSYGYYSSDYMGRGVDVENINFSSLPSNAIVQNIVINSKVSSQTAYGGFIIYFHSVSGATGISKQFFKGQSVSAQYFTFEITAKQIEDNYKSEKGTAKSATAILKGNLPYISLSGSTTGSILSKKQAEVRVYDVYVTATYTMPF